MDERELPTENFELRTEFWDEVGLCLGGRSRRCRGCAGEGEGGMEGVVHELIIAEKKILVVSRQFAAFTMVSDFAMTTAD